MWKRTSRGSRTNTRRQSHSRIPTISGRRKTFTVRSRRISIHWNRYSIPINISHRDTPRCIIRDLCGLDLCSQCNTVRVAVIWRWRVAFAISTIRAPGYGHVVSVPEDVGLCDAPCFVGYGGRVWRGDSFGNSHCRVVSYGATNDTGTLSRRCLGIVRRVWRRKRCPRRRDRR